MAGQMHPGEISMYLSAPVQKQSFSMEHQCSVLGLPYSAPNQTMPQPVKHARRCICGARPKPDGTLPCDH